MDAEKIKKLELKLREKFKYYKISLEKRQTAKAPKRAVFDLDVVIRRREGEQDKRIPLQRIKV